MTGDRRSSDFHEYYKGIALALRKKANCTGNPVGAVIVKHNRACHECWPSGAQEIENAT